MSIHPTYRELGERVGSLVEDDGAGLPEAVAVRGLLLALLSVKRVESAREAKP